MATRPDLQAMLEELLGSRNVYNQPPESIKMKYPAILYTRKNIDTNRANNGVYKQDNCYEVILIDPNPDSEYVSKLSHLPMCRFDRHYTADGLNHDVFTLYY